MKRWKVRGFWYDDVDNIDHTKVPCVKCNKLPTPCLKCPADSPWKNSHDPCIGHLPGVKGVCCGHGDLTDAYLAYENGWWGRETAILLLEYLTGNKVG